jgi:hypothetical protein
MSATLASRRAALAAGAALFAAAPAAAQAPSPQGATPGNGANGGSGARRAPSGAGGDLVQGFSRERLGRLGPAFAREASAAPSPAASP